MTHSVTRYHDICAGHRVAGHENKCSQLHGHNYRFHFTCQAEVGEYHTEGELDALGRVMDFSVVKERLCMWLERNWDHRFLAWAKDDYMREINLAVSMAPSPIPDGNPVETMWGESICWVPFNPTAENMAQYLVEEVGPRQLEGTCVELTQVTIDETRKCSATYRIKR